MRKLLVISNDLASQGVKPGPHTFHPRHEEEIRVAADDAMQVVVATPHEALSHIADAEVVAAFPMRVPKLADVPNAKWLHSFSAGVDTILTSDVIASSVIVSNSSGIHATPIAEHIVAVVLLWVRGFYKTFRAKQRHEWAPDDSLRELRGASVLIVGMGAIGDEAARLLNGFGAHVKAVSRSKKEKPEYVEQLETAETLNSMLPEADFVVITLPHTSETHYLFDAKKFALMKSNAFIINIGRGGIINEQDLIVALREKKIAGAGLDVFEKEPLPADSPLWDMENVIITPHHSGLSDKYMDRAVDRFCLNLRAYLAGEKLPNEVDKTLGY